MSNITIKRKCETFYNKYVQINPDFKEICYQASDPNLGHIERYDLVYEFFNIMMPRVAIEFGPDFTITDFVYWLEEDYIENE